MSDGPPLAYLSPQLPSLVPPREPQLGGAQPLVSPLVRKGSHDIVDSGDRARSYSRCIPVRIPLDQIGFWHGNRGNAGILGFHIHRICRDIKKHGTNLHRYNHVAVVEIPTRILEKIAAINRARCKMCPYMPKFPEQLRYVCLSKTHFTHAQKLFKDGNRTLFNFGRIPFEFKATDNEGPQISLQGITCMVYKAALV